MVHSKKKKLWLVLKSLFYFRMVGGKGEAHANIAEGLATALQCFEDLQLKRDGLSIVQKHCILICNSPPYQLPVMETPSLSGHSVDELATFLLEVWLCHYAFRWLIDFVFKIHCIMLLIGFGIFLFQRGINLSILSPRKIPALFKLYEVAGGDLQISQTKNYAKDPRHLVLLKGFRFASLLYIFAPILIIVFDFIVHGNWQKASCLLFHLTKSMQTKFNLCAHKVWWLISMCCPAYIKLLLACAVSSVDSDQKKFVILLQNSSYCFYFNMNCNKFSFTSFLAIFPFFVTWLP